MTVFIKPAAALVLAIGLALLGACASSSFTSSTAKQYPAWPGEVKVLKQLPPPGHYVLIGIVRVEGPNLASDERLYAEMKTQAAAQGANVVVPQAGIKNRDTGTSGKLRVLVAYAIRIQK